MDFAFLNNIPAIQNTISLLPTLSLPFYLEHWFGALLFIRIAILLISAVVPANNFSVFTLSISVSAGALLCFTSIGPAVYRSKVTSAFETALFTNLALLGLAKFYVNAVGGNQTASSSRIMRMRIARRS